MSAISIRSLLEQLTGEEVRVFIEDGRIRGKVAGVTDDLLILCSNDDVVWIDIKDIEAVRVVGSHHSSHDDEE